MQVIFDRTGLAKAIAKLPEDGWTRRVGEYVSSGEEHVMWDALWTAKDLEDEALREDEGLDVPVRFALPAGTYVIEEYGTWHPTKASEIMLARLAPLLGEVGDDEDREGREGREGRTVEAALDRLQSSDINHLSIVISFYDNLTTCCRFW